MKLKYWKKMKFKYKIISILMLLRHWICGKMWKMSNCGYTNVPIEELLENLINQLINFLTPKSSNASRKVQLKCFDFV